MKHDPRGIRACFMAAFRARSVGNILVRQSKCRGFSPSTQELRTLACDDDISCQLRCDAVLNRTPFCVATTYCLQKFEVGIKNRSFHQSASRRAEKEGGSSFLEDLPKKSFLNSLLVNVRLGSSPHPSIIRSNTCQCIVKVNIIYINVHAHRYTFGATW